MVSTYVVSTLQPSMRSLNFWACKCVVLKNTFLLKTFTDADHTFHSYISMANVFIVAPESLSSLLEGTPNMRKDAMKYVEFIFQGS